MMKLRAAPWILLMAALSLMGSVGCGEDSPSTSTGGNGAERPGNDDDDDDVGDGDDDGDDDVGDDDDDGDDDQGPAADAGARPNSERKDSGAAGPSMPGRDAAAKPTDAGSTSGNSSDASSSSTKDDAGPAGNDGDAGMTSPPPASGGKILPPADPTKMGPFMTKTEILGGFRVWYPTELGKDGLKHPIFVWGTGSGALPDRYNDHFGQMASHGFVIISPNKTQKGASDMKAALEYILAENGKSGGTFGGKLDPDRIAMGGHSQGSIATFDHEATDTRLKTTIHIAGGSFDGQGSSKVKTPTAYICGETDFALPNCQRDFMNVKDKPTFFSVLKGVDHVQCARAALPGMIAWLRWHLAGETERAAMFTGPDGDFHKGIWKSETKNWKY